ncbi:MAG: nucleoside deaminase [Myxococcota bacterium]|nr:nucleoside deaminase [Myxococcota bacterium]
MGHSPIDKLDFMRQAILLAQKSMADGRGGPFGAIVVKDGVIIASGQNRVVIDADPTAHAEIVAIRRAAAALGTHLLSGCHIYASCEPCPMCLCAIQWARIDRIYYGSTRKDAAAAGFDDAFFYEDLSKPAALRRIPSEQLLADEATTVLAAWTQQKNKIPY